MAPGPSPSISFTASFDDSDGTSIKTSNIRRGVIFYLTLMGPRGGGGGGPLNDVRYTWRGIISNIKYEIFV